MTASNDKDINAIEQMLDEDCQYASSGVGEYTGKEAILSMMAAFFTANPDVQWTVPEYGMVSDRCVEFQFTISLGGATSRGTERIWFNDKGAISCIEVER